MKGNDKEKGVLKKGGGSLRQLRMGESQEPREEEM